ncbi:molybdopterin molybdotransferase MoeA [Natranaerobius trueperi]|nr:molybdopterin molybdotransferase MoeA [Natranaerobius trueperi]
MIDPEKAYKKILENTSRTVELKPCSLTDSIGKILGEDVFATENIPPFDKSTFDGFAFASKKTKNASAEKPITFEVATQIPAGETIIKNKYGKLEGKAVRIMTGAPLPEGFDCVIPFEKVEGYNDKIVLKIPLFYKENVSSKGEEIKKGEKVLEAGTKISPFHIGVLSSLGFREIKIKKAPTIGIITTGNELVEVEKTLEKGKIRNSNKYYLLSYLQSIGYKTLFYGNVHDSLDDLKQKFHKALTKVDFLITTGGVSVGDYDLVPRALKEIGATQIFWRVNMKPGKFMHFSIFNNVPIFSLSGNPAAMTTSFKTMVEKPLLKSNGYSNIGNELMSESVSAFLKQSLKKNSCSHWRLIRARRWIEDGKLYCKPVEKDKTGISSTIIGANGIIVIPPYSSPVKENDLVDFLSFNELKEEF